MEARLDYLQEILSRVRKLNDTLRGRGRQIRVDYRIDRSWSQVYRVRIFGETFNQNHGFSTKDELIAFLDGMLSFAGLGD